MGGAAHGRAGPGRGGAVGEVRKEAGGGWG